MGRCTWRAPAEQNQPRLPPPYEHYKLLKWLGAGGMAAAYLAVDTRFPSHRRVIKFFDPTPWNGQLERLRTQLDWEVKIGNESQSERLARSQEFLDLSKHVDAGWLPFGLVMKYYATSLAEVIEFCRKTDARLPIALARDFLRQIAEGMRYLHNHFRIVHRDIKPANILFDLPDGVNFRGVDSLSDASAVLADFGVALPIDSELFPRLGQDGYKAAELFKPDGPDGPRRAQPNQDVYSFGVVGRELIPMIGVGP